MTTFRTFVEAIIGFFNATVIPLLLALLLLVFLWGILRYFFLNRDDPNARKEGSQFILWGIIGLTVVISMWGLVTILLETFGL